MMLAWFELVSVGIILLGYLLDFWINNNTNNNNNIMLTSIMPKYMET